MIVKSPDRQCLQLDDELLERGVGLVRVGFGLTPLPTLTSRG